MMGFAVFQVLFDAVLVFAMFFLVHYLVHRVQRKKEDSDLLQTAQAQEIRENLQELLTTLKQLGKEISEDIQEQVSLAEQKTGKFKGLLLRAERDLSRAAALAEKAQREREYLEEKTGKPPVLQSLARKPAPEPAPEKPQADPEPRLYMKDAEEAPKKTKGKPEPQEKGRAIGVSSELVKEIYRLADESHGLNEIVQKTKLTAAEVKLILNLRGNRYTTHN
jgi:hypothetical protein